jgi:hypothetical protein
MQHLVEDVHLRVLDKVERVDLLLDKLAVHEGRALDFITLLPDHDDPVLTLDPGDNLLHDSADIRLSNIDVLSVARYPGLFDLMYSLLETESSQRMA